ncbi:MAG: VPLPA-CTERM sorting domain-containing protein [Pseudomonadota bacterium]
MSRSFGVLLAVALCAGTVAQVASAATFTVTSSFTTPTDNALASGTVAQNAASGTFALTTNIASTNWDNRGVERSSAGGIQARVRNRSTSPQLLDIFFSVTPASGSAVDFLTVRQAALGGSNGNGRSDGTALARFTLSWAGGGLATVFDSANQLNTVGPISSGTVIDYNLYVENSNARWSVRLPTGVTSVTLSAEDTPASTNTLATETYAFDVALSSTTPAPIPLPPAVALMVGGLAGLAGLRARRKVRANRAA